MGPPRAARALTPRARRQVAGMFTAVHLGVTREAGPPTGATRRLDTVTEPRFRGIAEALERDLAVLPAGGRVASEHEIARRFGVGRAAARAAVGDLERRHLVRRVQGAGTFVNRPIDYVISRDRPPSWHATVRAAGRTPRSVVRAVEEVPAEGEIARRLACEPGTPVRRLRRIHHIDDLLVSSATEWLVNDLVHELRHALAAADESLDVVLRQMGRVDPVREWCRVVLDVADPEVAGELGLAEGDAVWCVESASRDGEHGPPLMCSRTWTRPDAARVAVEFGTDPAVERVAQAPREESST